MSPIRRRGWLLLLLGLILGSCSLPVPPPPPPQRVVFVTDGGRVDDGSLNEAILEGLLAAQEEAGFELHFEEPQAPDLDLLLDLLGQRPGLMILHGSAAAELARTLAGQHEEVAFLVVDAPGAGPPPAEDGPGVAGGAGPANLASITWDEVEGVRLAGRLTASVREGTVGAVLQTAESVAWDAAFREGVAGACPGCPVRVLPLRPADPPSAGRLAGEELVRQGALAVFAAGGEAAAAGLQPVAESQVWVAGGWVDVYRTLFGAGAVRGAHRLFGSVVKDAAPAVREAVWEWSQGTLGSRQGGWRLAPPHDAAEWLPGEALERLEALAGQVR